MSSKSINDVRDHLFTVLETLGDPDKTADLERARMIVEVAQTIINSAKVEVEHLRVIGDTGKSAFLAPSDKEQLPPGTTGILQHRMR